MVTVLQEPVVQVVWAALENSGESFQGSSAEVRGSSPLRLSVLTDLQFVAQLEALGNGELPVCKVTTPSHAQALKALAESQGTPLPESFSFSVSLACAPPLITHVACFLTTSFRTFLLILASSQKVLLALLSR